MVRLLVAHVLRLIVALCVGLAIVFSLFTVVGLALSATGKQDIRHLGFIAVMTIGAIALLLSLARLAHLVLARIVDLDPPPKPRT